MSSMLCLTAIVLASVPGPEQQAGAKRAVTGVDPISRAPIAGVPPELSPPLLDVLGASLKLSEDGPAVRAVIAPVAYFTHNPILSTARLEVGTGGDNGRFDFAVSLGYSPALLPDVGDQSQKVQEKCLPLQPLEERDLQYLMERLQQALPAPQPDSCLEPTDIDPGLPLEKRAARLVAAHKRCSTKGDDQETAEDEESARVRSALESALRARNERTATCAEKIYSEVREKKAFDNTFSAHLKGAVELFPFISEPQVRDDEGVLQDPTPNTWASVSGGVSGAYFWKKKVGVWLTGSLTRAMAEPGSAIGTQLGGSLQVAYNFATGEEGEGAPQGYALGAFTNLSRCTAGTCEKEVRSYDDPIEFSTRWQMGAFLDIRASSKVQIRLSLPLENYWLSAPPEGSEEGTKLLQFIPSLSLTVADWSA